jgi:hypothetical protein
MNKKNDTLSINSVSFLLTSFPCASRAQKKQVNPAEFYLFLKQVKNMALYQISIAYFKLRAQKRKVKKTKKM